MAAPGLKSWGAGLYHPSMKHALLLAGLLVCPAAAQDPATGEDVISRLQPEHPRLILTEKRLRDLRLLSTTDELLAKAVADVRARADAYLEAAPLEHELQGPRLLHVSRECLARVYALGLAWRWTNYRQYLERAQENLLTVCAFPDWNPSHFLDTAEMSHAVGLGYDWCFAGLDPEARETIRRGLIEKGLEPGMLAYTASKTAWWVNSAFNWNQVCNGGLVVGALAIAETDPKYAETIVPHAVRSLPRALETYEPDGAWGEGPGYWSYATHYTVYGLAAMRTALGTDFGLSERQGLLQAGFFPLSATGPTGLVVAYADVGERARRTSLPALFWLADRDGEPALSAAERAWIAEHRADPQHVIWYVPPGDVDIPEPPLDELYRGPVELVLLRSAHDDPDALFVAMKAGYNAVNHGHLDLGNFELDALGVRWARDLGADDYNLPGYWDGKEGGRRWSYYRLGSHSHNVLTIDGKQQAVAGKARFTVFDSKADSAHAILEITDAWPGLATSVRRGVALRVDRSAILLQDELELSRDVELAWGMTTDATIEIHGNRATLTQDEKILEVVLVEPLGAAFTVESAEREPPDRKNEGVRRLVMRHPLAAGPARIVVLFQPGGGAPPRIMGEIVAPPLSEW